MNKKMFLSLVLVSGMGLASACTESGCAHKAQSPKRWYPALEVVQNNADKAITFVKEHKAPIAAVAAAAVLVTIVAKACTTKAVETDTEENWGPELAN